MKLAPVPWWTLEWPIRADNTGYFVCYLLYNNLLGGYKKNNLSISTRITLTAVLQTSQIPQGLSSSWKPKEKPQLPGTKSLGRKRTTLPMTLNSKFPNMAEGKVSPTLLYPANLDMTKHHCLRKAYYSRHQAGSTIKVLLWSNSRYPFFYIFIHNKGVQDILLNFNLLRTTELMSFEPLFPRIYGRH